MQNIEDTRFRMTKETAMRKLDKAIKENKVDPQLVAFLKTFNKLKNVFSSSSCAGRIILIGLDKEETKKPELFVGKWHRNVKLNEIIDLLAKNLAFEEIWFKQEAFIFHFVCKNLHYATKMLQVKTKLGIKRGGIFQIKEGRYIIEIMGTANISLPVKFGKKVLLNEKQILLILEKANQKLEKNYNVLKEFESKLLRELKK